MESVYKDLAEKLEHLKHCLKCPWCGRYGLSEPDILDTSGPPETVSRMDAKLVCNSCKTAFVLYVETIPE